jgi:hypothetical protein
VITLPQRAVQSFPVRWGLRQLFGTFSPILVQGFCRILPDFLGAEQLSIPLKVLIVKRFRFLQQTLIKERLGISDRETVEQIKENPYLQYFIGQTQYSNEAPYDASLLVR